MTLEAAGQLCFDQVPLILKPLPLGYWPTPDWQDRIRFLFAEETRHKKTVNAAMRTFVATRQWPHLPVGSPTFLACVRLQEAVALVHILRAGTPPVTAHGSSDSRLLTWLLLETWNQWSWQPRLKLEALSSLSGVLYEKP